MQVHPNRPSRLFDKLAVALELKKLAASTKWNS